MQQQAHLLQQQQHQHYPAQSHAHFSSKPPFHDAGQPSHDHQSSLDQPSSATPSGFDRSEQHAETSTHASHNGRDQSPLLNSNDFTGDDASFSPIFSSESNSRFASHLQYPLADTLKEHDNSEDDFTTQKRNANTTKRISNKQGSPSPFSHEEHPSSLSMYCSSLVSNWVNNYDIFVTPSHSLLPVNRKSFESIVPHLLRDLMKENGETKENNFFLCSLISVSALTNGDISLSRSFYAKARELSGSLFDVIDYRIGLGFILLSFYSYINLQFEKCITFLRIAKNVASYFPGSHLDKQCIIACAYTANDTDTKIKYFEKLGNSESGLTMADVLWSKVGTAVARVEKDPQDAVVQLRIVEEANEMLTPENVESGRLNMWHWFFVHAHRTTLLSACGNHEEAVVCADALLKKTSNPRWKYFCIPMRVRILLNVCQVYISKKESPTHEDWTKISQIYDQMSELIKYPLAFTRLNDLMKQIEARRDQVSKRSEPISVPKFDLPESGKQQLSEI